MEKQLILILEQSRARLKEMQENIDSLGKSLDVDSLKTIVADLEEQTQAPDFWADPQSSQQILSKMKAHKDKLDGYLNLKHEFESVSELLELAIEADDESLTDEILADIRKVEDLYNEQKIALLLSGEYDANNVLISIHPGAGGTEAQDWASMLYRMYQRFAERRGFTAKTLDYLDGDEAGLKSVTLQISGPYAYGYLKSEGGVHRLVRVSPFDSSGRRHTSFASVEVMPEFTDDLNIEIREEDLKIEAHRSSGAGGQHVNKTDSAIRITHIPTGIVVGCQTERSQLQNKETAMKMLKSKLLEIKEREHLEKVEDIQGIKANIEWGSQIRSYVFMPYTLVKDHRTNCETGDVSRVMDGDIDAFINAYLQYSVDNK